MPQDNSDQQNKTKFQMPLEEQHVYYMLLHDQVDIIICTDGFAQVKYHPHMSEETRRLCGFKSVAEQLHEVENIEDRDEA